MKRAAALALVLALAACSGAKTEGYANHRFTSTQEIADVVAAAGWTCDGHDRAKTAARLAQGGFDAAPCDDGSIVIYASDAKRAELRAKNPARPGWKYVAGANWEAMGAVDKIDAANKVLKGREG